jgi:hypothetical protein
MWYHHTQSTTETLYIELCVFHKSTWEKSFTKLPNTGWSLNTCVLEHLFFHTMQKSSMEVSFNFPFKIGFNGRDDAVLFIGAKFSPRCLSNKHNMCKYDRWLGTANNLILKAKNLNISIICGQENPTKEVVVQSLFTNLRHRVRTLHKWLGSLAAAMPQGMVIGEKWQVWSKIRLLQDLFVLHT